MRIFFLLAILYLLYSCDNDLNTIGDTMIPSEGLVEAVTFSVDETSTVRLDSFPTSLNVYSGFNFTSPYTKDAYQLTVGRVVDKVTGSTTATPYFQVFSTGYDPNLIRGGENYSYDSLTLSLFTKDNLPTILAGDTTQVQIFHLYRLKDYPHYRVDDPVIYDNFSLPYEDTPLATLRIRPQREYMQNNILYFKLDNQLGRQLFNEMKWQNEIFTASRALDFIRYFNGLVIVPDENNTVLFPLDASTLSLRCWYHSGATPGSFILPAYAANQYGSPYYAFTNIEHKPTDNFSGISWKNAMPFSEHNMTVVQGLDGYMMKLKLPFIPTGDTYKTILKVELELQPKLTNFENIPEPGTSIPLQVFKLDEYSRITGTLTNISGNAIYAVPYTNPNYPENRQYKIDITDYYKSAVANGYDLNPQLNLLIGLAGTPAQIGPREIRTMVGYVSMTFDRLIIDETPKLRIYYAKYK